MTLTGVPYVAWIAVLVGFVLVGLGVWQRSVNRSQRRQSGLKLLAAMRLLLSHVQKHRGLSNGFLKGSSPLLGEIVDLQNTVSRDFYEITQISRSIEAEEDWQGVTQHWARLAGNFRRLDPENNFVQHNRLVKNIIQMIDRIVRERDLGKLRNRNKRFFEAYISELLSAVEAVGRTRAIGTGVAAAGMCDDRSRARLEYLCDRIVETYPSLRNNLEGPDRVLDSLRELVTCIRADILCKPPKLSSEEYFAVASRAFDELSKVLDASLREAYWY